MNISRDNVYKFFKYAVYAALTINVYLFFAEEWAAAAHRFVDGIALEDVIEGFAASIDTAAWVVLLLMFELETLSSTTSSSHGGQPGHCTASGQSVTRSSSTRFTAT